MAAQKKTPVYERGLQIFRDEVTRNPKIKDRLLQMLLDLVQRERQGVRMHSCTPRPLTPLTPLSRCCRAAHHGWQTRARAVHPHRVVGTGVC